jgi:hypothetical protein
MRILALVDLTVSDGDAGRACMRSICHLCSAARNLSEAFCFLVLFCFVALPVKEGGVIRETWSGFFLGGCSIRNTLFFFSSLHQIVLLLMVEFVLLAIHLSRICQLSSLIQSTAIILVIPRVPPSSLPPPVIAPGVEAATDPPPVSNFESTLKTFQRNTLVQV